MKVITTADKFRVTEGQLVWFNGRVVKIGQIGPTLYGIFVIDSASDMFCANHLELRIFHPETGVKASDFAHDAVEVELVQA